MRSFYWSEKTKIFKFVVHFLFQTEDDDDLIKWSA